MPHPLHKIIGEIVDDVTKMYPKCDLIKDTACGGNQSAPLFIKGNKSRKTELCNVDLLLVMDDKIKVIIEIEESDITPIRICGKFLTSALSSYYNYALYKKGTNIPMSDAVTFIQVLNTTNLKGGETSKFGQWENLEKLIMNILPIKGCKIRKYKILYGNVSDFKRLSRKSIPTADLSI